MWKIYLKAAALELVFLVAFAVYVAIQTRLFSFLAVVLLPLVWFISAARIKLMVQVAELVEGTKATFVSVGAALGVFSGAGLAFLVGFRSYDLGIFALITMLSTAFACHLFYERE